MIADKTVPIFVNVSALFPDDMMGAVRVSSVLAVSMPLAIEPRQHEPDGFLTSHEQPGSFIFWRMSVKASDPAFRAKFLRDRGNGMTEAVAQRTFVGGFLHANRNRELIFGNRDAALLPEVHHVAFGGIAKPPASISLWRAYNRIRNSTRLQRKPPQRTHP